jgi:hypothetical protein
MASPAYILINELLYKRKSSLSPLQKNKANKTKLHKIQVTTTSAFHKQPLPVIKKQPNNSAIKCEIKSTKLKLPTQRNHRIVLPKVKSGVSAGSPQRCITDTTSPEPQGHNKSANISASFIRLKPMQNDSQYSAIDCINELIRIVHCRNEDFLIMESLADVNSGKLRLPSLETENSISHLETREGDRMNNELYLAERLQKYRESENVRKYTYKKHNNINSEEEHEIVWQVPDWKGEGGAA